MMASKYNNKSNNKSHNAADKSKKQNKSQTRNKNNKSNKINNTSKTNNGKANNNNNRTNSNNKNKKTNNKKNSNSNKNNNRNKNNKKKNNKQNNTNNKRNNSNNNHKNHYDNDKHTKKRFRTLDPEVQYEMALENASSASERHKLRRAKIDAERAERRKQEEEREARRKKMAYESGRSSKIMATWKLHGGAKTKSWGEVRGGYFYTGSNPDSLIEPNIPEPSLLSPRYEVADSSEDAEVLPLYPSYSTLSSQQRRKYIQFLASDRTETDDIGIVFLYLAGFERRLIIDAKKPGEVNDDEKKELTEELLRIFQAFGTKSDSIRHYIAMLLLYDGTVFKIKNEEWIKSFFCLDDNSVEHPLRLYMNVDNADAMSYLLLARLSEYGYSLPRRLLVECAINSLARSATMRALGIDFDKLRSEETRALISERLKHLAPSKEEQSRPTRLTDSANPIYFTASIGIRKVRRIEIDSSVVAPPDCPISLTKIAALAFACYKDMEEVESILSSSSLRNIDNAQYDALRLSLPPRCALDTFFKNKQEFVAVPMRVIRDDLRRRFGHDLSYTAKGTLNIQSQNLIALTVAMTGWQAMLPETVECLASQSWKLDETSTIVMFRRGVAHSRKSGKRCIGKVFGNDEKDYKLSLPGNWNEAICLAYIYAWFINECSELDTQDINKFSSIHFPPLAPQNQMQLRKNQIRLFSSIMFATVNSNLSSRQVTAALNIVPFESVQDVIFTLCDSKFGNIIPTDALEAIEYLYTKADKNKSMVLYDYHAGNYHVNKTNDDIGFTIDAEKLADTIASTSDVHSILSEAIGTAADFDLDDDSYIEEEPDDANELEYDDDEDDMQTINEQKQEVDTLNDDTATSLSNEKSAVRATESRFEATFNNEAASVQKENKQSLKKAENSGNQQQKNDIIALFDGEDEMATSELLQKLMDINGFTTTSEAMSYALKISSENGDFLEIDGADAYLDI